MENAEYITKLQFNRLPKTTGVYLFFEKNEIIYIGKAINIKDRVKNHFMQPSYRDHLFIQKVSRISFIETGSEIEALVLEAELIKKHLPKFNVVWKDDKNYFYVAVAKNQQKIPYIFITHQKNDRYTQYVGPFVEGNPLKKTLKYLRKVFPYYTSARHPKNQCTWCHLGLCPGPNPDVVEYKKNLKKLILILQGKRKTAANALKKEMANLAKHNEFEKAGKIRDKMQALEQVMQHTHVILHETLQGQTLQYIAKSDLGLALQKLIKTNKEVRKIECYDISNIQGKFATGSMVVFVNGMPDKNQYKKFRIQMKNEPNDIAMLKEVLTRRLLHPEWGYPEVMLIDGGIAQLNVAIKAKNATPTTKTIKIISIAKGKQELLIENKPKIPLKNLPQEVYNVIVALDDEAHRFAVSYHKKLRKRALLS
jgi:excinuclease ABC subunit C